MVPHSTSNYGFNLNYHFNNHFCFVTRNVLYYKMIKFNPLYFTKGLVVFCIVFYIVIYSYYDQEQVSLLEHLRYIFQTITNSTMMLHKSNIERLIPLGITCSNISSLSGFNQKVISYTVEGSSSNYWKGLPEILYQVHHIYNGWFVRIYTSNPNNQLLTNLSRIYDNLHICDINNLPAPMVSLKGYPVTMWRYHVLSDPQVEVVNFRDSDSKILIRERDAVQEWLTQTNKSMHIMRDHPDHYDPVLGGMWGAKLTPSNRALWKSLKEKMFSKAYNITPTKRIDQDLLKEVVWPVLKNVSIAHDSYTCKLFPGSVPFPTQRSQKDFIGAKDYLEVGEPVKITIPCPEECRPPKQKGWLYC